MQSNSCSFETDYLGIQDEYLCRISDNTKKQYKCVAIQVTQDIIDLAKYHNTDACSLRSYLDTALELLLDLKDAVNDGEPDSSEKEKIETLYTDLNWNRELESNLPWLDGAEKINIIALNEIINKYLSYEWFSSSIFEHVIINAFIRYSIEINRKAFKKNLAESSSIRTYVFYAIIGITLYCLMPVALIILAFLGVNSFISMLAERKAEKYDLKILLQLISLKTYVSGITWSPTAVMKRITELDKIFYIPELIPLVSKMISRNPNIFNTHYY
ncbi:MAG: hypothetical protein ABI597_04605 [Gammaproteobacteria bacterium]